MANIMDKFQNFLKFENDEDYDYEEDEIDGGYEKPSLLPTKVEEVPEDVTSIKKINKPITSTSRNKRATGSNMEVVRMKPGIMEDSRTISDFLLSGKVVFLDLEDVDLSLAQRVMDFISGVVYAIGGTLKQMSKATFVITPSAVSVSDLTDDSNQADASKVLF